MARSLSSADFSRLEQTSRTLLSPLAYDDPDDWRAASMQALLTLVGAQNGSFYLPGRPRNSQTFGADDRYEELLNAYTEATWTGTGLAPEPVLDEFHAQMLRRRVAVWNMEFADKELLGGTGRAWRNTFYHEVLERVGLRDSHGLFFPTPRGSVMLTAGAFRAPPSGDEWFPLFRVLLPSLVAGVDALGRLSAHRAALDLAGEALAAFDADGAPTHRTPALAALLAADPEAGRLEDALRDLAARARPLAFGRRYEAAADPPPAVEVGTARGRYALRVSLLPPSAFAGDDAFLVSVVAEGIAAVLPSPSCIRERHGLTRREAEVALLVAEGLSNEAIAERLFVSRHTVRHHVESAMSKLDLTGRGREAVASRLLTAEAV